MGRLEVREGVCGYGDVCVRVCVCGGGGGAPHTHTLTDLTRKTRKCGSFIYLADMKKRTIFTNCLLDFKHDLTFTFHVLLNCWRLWIQIEISIFQILLNVC